MRIMALDYAGGHPCDTAFLDVEMAGMSGMALAERLRRMKPDVNIIFVTGHGSYRDGAFGLHASGYLMKPVTARKVREELKDLRYPRGLSGRKAADVPVQPHPGAAGLSGGPAGGLMRRGGGRRGAV